MQIKASESENLFLDLANGKRMRLPNTVIAEISDSGLLTLTDGDIQTMVYPPSAWICLKKSDPSAMAAQMIMRRGIPDTPEGLE